MLLTTATTSDAAANSADLSRSTVSSVGDTTNYAEECSASTTTKKRQNDDEISLSLTLSLAPFSCKDDDGVNSSRKSSKKVSVQLTLDNDIPPDLELRLSLGHAPDNHHHQISWTITKKLTESDVNLRQNRLLISKKSMEKHVLFYLDEAARGVILGKGCVPIIVKDCDRDDGHEVTLSVKQWKTTSYVIGGYTDNKTSWKKSVVDPKKLVVGDVIGIKWDYVNRKLLLGLVDKCIKTTTNQTQFKISG